MTKAIDWERFEKLLNMTASDQDGESLSAVRLANDMLRRSGLNWKDVLAIPVKAEPAKVQPPVRPEHDDPISYSYTFSPSVVIDAERKAQRERIRSTSLLLRMILFPIWIVAETFVAVLYREKGLVPIVMGVLAVLIVAGFSGGLWAAIASSIYHGLFR